MKSSILFVTKSSNWPLTDGKRQRTWFLIEALSEKFNVDLLLIGCESENNQIEISTNTIKNIYFFDTTKANLPDVGYPTFLLSKKQKSSNDFFYNKLNQLFCQLNNENKYSFVFSRYLWPLLLLSLPQKIKIVCDVDDVYFEAQKSRIQKETNFLRKLKLQVFFFIGTKKVKELLNRIDVPIIVKESDRIYYGLKKAVCLPNIPFGFHIDNKFQINNTFQNFSEIVKFGFIGKLSYRPNYQGLIDFINLVWNPLMKNKLEARLVIAGSGEMPKKLAKLILDSKNIDFLGFVKSPNEFWSQISYLIVPIAEGAGSNIKVAEAFIYGKFVIANPFASRGYEEFIGSEYLRLPKNNQEWIKIMNNIELPNINKTKCLSAKANELFNLELWKQNLLNSVS